MDIGEGAVEVEFSSEVEKRFLAASGRKPLYAPAEKIPVIQVENFPALGKLTALRFLEWVRENPGGVVSLPTGKTPEYFIKWVTHFLENWEEPAVREELESGGLEIGTKPDIRSLHFVQIDEFFPMDSELENSFYSYVKKYYIDGFGFDAEKALLINVDEIGRGEREYLSLEEIFPGGTVDLSLRTRLACTRLEEIQKRTIEKVDAFCTEYESKIRGLGGIGFFLGGIGPDGHIGFNVRGSDLYSTTRLAAINYETQAAAATDLGGIEVARSKLVITIGLRTLTYNADAVVIIIAAGEAKARIVRDSVQSDLSNLYPATALQQLPSARFFLTKGAALRLRERRYEDLRQADSIPDNITERIVFDLAVKSGKRLTELAAEDFSGDEAARIALQKSDAEPDELSGIIENLMKRKIERGMQMLENEVFLHTAPHHDDIMLGYLPLVIHLVRTPLNEHHFNYMTSGFTAVTNDYAYTLLKDLKGFIRTEEFRELAESGYFAPESIEGRNRDVNLYLDGVAEGNEEVKREATSRRLLRSLREIFREEGELAPEERMDELVSYFRTVYPGKKDLVYVQRLKGMIREWEADLLWGYFGFGAEKVNHLRLGFYKGDLFTEEPDVSRDVIPILELIRRIKPTVLTVALDPEGSGPDTHYKVMQAVSEALQMYEEECDAPPSLRVWGYRNVWHRFHPSEVEEFVPVSLNSLAIMEKAFVNCFGSQKSASFPSYEYDGPFSGLARKVLVEQYLKIKGRLGRDYFIQNEHPRLRASHGMVFIRELSLGEFYRHSRRLRKNTENL